MLKDSVGRHFHYLRLSITDVCNFKCNYCLPEGYKKDGKPSFLTQDEIQNVVSGFAACGVEKIRVTGGEPVVRKDLPNILSSIKQTPGIKTLALTTNGYRLPSYIPVFAQAQLDKLNISIDSLDPQVFRTITGHDRLKEILEGLDMALASAIPSIKVNTVLMKGLNDDELGEFLAWIKHLPVTLRFIEVMQTGDNEAFFNRHHLSGQSIKQQLLDQGWRPVLKEREAGPAQEFWHPDYIGRIGLIMPYSKDFCDSCNRLRVSATGKLHLCLFGEQGYDLRPWLQSPDQQPELIEQIHLALENKLPSHFLHQGATGATRDLSMLGG